jgi:hypothetical protein
VNGLAVPDDGPGEVADVAPTGNKDSAPKSTCLVLTADQAQLEALYASAVSLEYIRVRRPVDSRCAAAYAAQVVDNSRLLAGGDPRLHLNLMRSQIRWLRSLRVGSSQLVTTPGGMK